MPARAPESERRKAPIEVERRDGRHFLVLLAVAITLHGMVVLTGLFLHGNRQKPEDQLDLGIDVTLGEAVQELVVAQPSTEPAPPEPVPPPEPPTPPEPPPEPEPEPMPPPVEPPEFAEPQPTPKPPTPKVPPKKETTPKATPAKPVGAPPGAKVGPKPQAGVVGGNVTQGATTGTPGGQKVGNQGWRTPKPPYPAAALQSRIEGSGEVRISTNAAGKVATVVISRPINALLDANTRSFALGNWSGPPNTTRSVPVIYKMGR